ncbi:cyclic nucleotide-binding protein [Microvirga vignae]|uniref:Cyclic nucleotide-binding protein n=1 Tax=Microvirga vignae TaxID=1225564 RepID=A0A0H1R5K5_9HYPH|nr:Crp/Fnr family transcriptional regulator [Microvirga vignae]KLK90309.1 cyclic nucleotide-binding protein [Microvirga vignae]
MHNLLINKLEQFTKLSPEDKQVLADVARGRVWVRGAREDIIQEGDKPTCVNLILKGWACRYKMLPDGRRQIIAFFVPGDLCDLHVFVLRAMDHSIGALTPITFAEISRETLRNIMSDHPRITEALWWDALVTVAIQREWTVNLGQRSAFERLGHLLCELFLRLRAVGLTQGNACEFPVTQTELADATGLTTVHVNRTLQELRGEGLIELHGKHLIIPDLEALETASVFNLNYLHGDHEGSALDARNGEIGSAGQRSRGA